GEPRSGTPSVEEKILEAVNTTPISTRRLHCNCQHVYLLHNGALAHFRHTTSRYLDRRFPDRSIGRGGPIVWLLLI
ncbi:hypothetical protein C0J52_26114, partial [Blattella germanica]